ncbi:MAG: helix-turn-helix domain-containing protein [Cellulomonas sp.]
MSPTATPGSEYLEPALRAGLAALSPRERIVLCNLSEDVTLVEIAAVLWVSHNTIKSQVRSVYRKIGVGTRAEAVAWARAAGLPVV